MRRFVPGPGGATGDVRDWPPQRRGESAGGRAKTRGKFAERHGEDTEPEAVQDLDLPPLVITRRAVSRRPWDASGFMGMLAMNESATLSPGS